MLLALALAFTSAANAADPRKLGTQWEDRDGNTHITQLGLEIDGADDPDAALYRRAQFDWRRSDLQAGHYPKSSFAKRVQGVVRLAVDIDATGRPLACRTAATSGAADLDAHACAHVMTHTRYVPTLTRDGTARPETLAIALSYELGVTVVNMAAPGAASMPERPRVEPRTPVDAKLLGIAGERPPAGVQGFAVRMLVGADGVPTACLLREPTRVDAVDKRLCDAMLDRVRFPTAAGADVREYGGWVSWPAR